MTIFLEDKDITNKNNIHPAYRLIRDGNRQRIEAHNLCNALWEKYKEFSDHHFRQELARDFHARFWEMDLTISLLNQGLKIDLPSNNHGPDICIITKDNRKIRIEAIAPTAGKGDDEVPGYPSKPEETECIYLPEGQIILRYTSAIKEKYTKYINYRNDNIIACDEPYVIGINSAQIPYAFINDDIPLIVKSVFPIGNRFGIINTENQEVEKTGLQYRFSVSKKNGTNIPTVAFNNSDFSGISAIIYSGSSCCNRPRNGNGLTIVHNPFADNPLPSGTIACDREYYARIDGNNGELFCNSKEDNHLNRVHPKSNPVV